MTLLLLSIITITTITTIFIGGAAPRGAHAGQFSKMVDDPNNRCYADNEADGLRNKT